jgi:hypothetical protein
MYAPITPLMAPLAPTAGMSLNRLNPMCAPPRQQPAQQVEHEEAQVPHGVFDVVPEDPQEQHVPKEVLPAAVHEHGGQQRLRGDPLRPARPDDLARDGAELHQ